MMSALVMAAVALAARFEMSAARIGPRAAFGFWPLMLLLWGALNAVYVSRDLFNLYVGIELLSLAAVALVALSGTKQALAAALRYMIFALVGSLLMVFPLAGGSGSAQPWSVVSSLMARQPGARAQIGH